MRLMNSRLCLDCEEVHDQQHCPICGSESFAFLTRWVTPSDTAAAAEPAPRATRPPDPSIDASRSTRIVRFSTQLRRLPPAGASWPEVHSGWRSSAWRG